MNFKAMDSFDNVIVTGEICDFSQTGEVQVNLLPYTDKVLELREVMPPSDDKLLSFINDTHELVTFDMDATDDIEVAKENLSKAFTDYAEKHNLKSVVTNA